MEVLQVAELIEKIIAEIGQARRLIEDKGRARAKAISNYDMRLGIAVVELRDAGKYPATLIEKIAKKICCTDREALEIAESDYKAVISNLQALMAQLNGYQSIFRYLDTVAH